MYLIRKTSLPPPKDLLKSLELVLNFALKPKLHSILFIFPKSFFPYKFNISVDCKEALLMAVLGYAAYNKIPNNMPSVTGAKEISVYGKIIKG